MRLYLDLEIVCYAGEHKYFALFLAMPCLFVWGAGIPAFAFLKMRTHKDELGRIDVKERFGFLYNGYKPHAYYWEVVIMYRKIALIFISVFLSSISITVQALVVILFIILCLALNAIVQPFANHVLNSLETMSLLASEVSVYCGLYFLSG